MGPPPSRRSVGYALQVNPASRPPPLATAADLAALPDDVHAESVTNAERDLGTKLFAYQHAGIPHYWIIDPEHQTLTGYRLSAEGYAVALTAGKADRVHAPPFAEIELAVGELFGE